MKVDFGHADVARSGHRHGNSQEPTLSSACSRSPEAVFEVDPSGNACVGSVLPRWVFKNCDENVMKL